MDTIEELKDYVDKSIEGVSKKVDILRQRTTEARLSSSSGDAQIVTMLEDIKDEMEQRFQGAHERMDAIMAQCGGIAAGFEEMTRVTSENTETLRELMAILRGNIGRAVQDDQQ